MRLSDNYLLVVEERKVLGYLLNSGHPDGAPKARFFHAAGYDTQRWRSLAESLKLHATNNEVANSVESFFGKKFVVEGPMDTAREGAPGVRIVSVWIVERGSAEARLVTAYPFD